MAVSLWVLVVVCEMGHRLQPGSGLVVLSSAAHGWSRPLSSIPSRRPEPTRVLRLSLDESAYWSFSQTALLGGVQGPNPPHTHPPIFFSYSHFSRNTSIPAPGLFRAAEPTPSLHFAICESFTHAPSPQPSRTSPPGSHGSRHSSSPGTHYQGSGRASSGPVLVLGRTWLAMWDSHHLSFSFGLLPEFLC